MNTACRFKTLPSSRVGDLDEVPAEPVFSQPEPVTAADLKRGTKQDTLKCLIFFLETCQKVIFKKKMFTNHYVYIIIVTM